MRVLLPMTSDLPLAPSAAPVALQTGCPVLAQGVGLGTVGLGAHLPSCSSLLSQKSRTIAWTFTRIGWAFEAVAAKIAAWQQLQPARSWGAQRAYP